MAPWFALSIVPGIVLLGTATAVTTANTPGHSIVANTISELAAGSAYAALLVRLALLLLGASVFPLAYAAHHLQERAWPVDVA
ncbi:MAG: hypothetical protein FJ318_06215 [SAR202 cluster bacterium]|nr:hypothetical protein [SAR202 cluster bacterium]